MLIGLRILLSEFFLYLALKIVPKQTFEAEYMACSIKDYLDKIENKNER
jgi:hypothetical protein